MLNFWKVVYDAIFYGEAVAAIKTAIIASWKGHFSKKLIFGLFDQILTTWEVSKIFFFVRRLLAIVDYPSNDCWFNQKLKLKFHGFVPKYKGDKHIPYNFRNSAEKQLTTLIKC